MSKLGIITYNAEVGAGAKNSAFLLKAAFERRGLDVTILNIGDSEFEAVVDFDPVHVASHPDTMSEYDYLLISDTGMELTDTDNAKQLFEALSATSARVGQLVHDEYVTQTKPDLFQDYFRLMDLSNSVSDIFGITNGILEQVREVFDFRNSYNFMLMPGTGDSVTRIDTVDSVQFSDKKVNTIGYAGRIVSRKKIIQLMRLAGKMSSTKLEMKGTRQPGIFNAKLENDAESLFGGLDSIYFGEFPSGTYPSESYFVSWNCVMLGRGNSCDFIPRVEIGTQESWEHGCIPILLNQSVPEWVPKDCYIGIDWLSINHTRRDWDGTAARIESEVARISAMDPSDIRELCKKALRSVDENWPISKSYDDFVRLVEGSDDGR